MIPVTIWYRKNRKTGEYEHNHIENGSPEDLFPTPINEDQRKAWSGASWNAKGGFLTDDYKLIVKEDQNG